MTQRKPRTVSSSRAAPLALTHPNAAGIDIGSASHFVAVPPDRDDEPVREFRSFTAELERLADWLAECGIDTVAMESTGVYWIPLFELLDARGFTVLLVNARHVKNVTRPQVRRARLPVAAAAHELRPAARGLPPGRRGVRAARPGAPARDDPAHAVALRCSTCKRPWCR